MLHHLKKKTNKCYKNFSLIKTQGDIFDNHTLPLQQWRNNIPVLLEELEKIRGQSQIVAQRLHLSLWCNYKEPEALINCLIQHYIKTETFYATNQQH